MTYSPSPEKPEKQGRNFPDIIRVRKMTGLSEPEIPKTMPVIPVMPSNRAFIEKTSPEERN
jgi:hypothetical protein